MLTAIATSETISLLTLCGRQWQLTAIDLMEPALPRLRRARAVPKARDSVVGVVDKSAVLVIVEQLQADASTSDSSLSDPERLRQALSVAHDEDVFGWRSGDR